MLVARRMVKHGDIKTVMSNKQRQTAVGTEADFPDDAMMTYMTRHAEQIFEPKRVLDDGDWLNSNMGTDQSFEFYKYGKGNIKWLSPTQNKIHLFIAENDSFTNDLISKFKLYVEAFYHGVAGVEVLKAGTTVFQQIRTAVWSKKATKIPIDLLKKEVQNRERFGDDKQYGTGVKEGIINKLSKYRPSDSHTMLLIMMKDLYPQPSWDFCFG